MIERSLLWKKIQNKAQSRQKIYNMSSCSGINTIDIFLLNFNWLITEEVGKSAIVGVKLG
jgi:hypothetical protein